MSQSNDTALREAIITLCRERGSEKSACPSEVARAVDPADWRALMPGVRRVAAALVRAGEIAVTQRGVAVDPATARGPIRLRLAPPRPPIPSSTAS